MKKTAYILANILVALVGGWRLAQFAGSLPYEMPSRLDSAIRGGIRFTGSAHLDTADDIETIAIIVIFLACSALGAVLALANFAGCRILSRRDKPL